MLQLKLVNIAENQKLAVVDFLEIMFFFLFQLPTVEQWYTASTTVYDVIFSKIDEENSDTILGRVKQTLVNHVDIGARFSEARCSKALPLAFAAYKEGLQSHYLAEVHNAKVNFLTTPSPSTITRFT